MPRKSFSLKNIDEIRGRSEYSGAVKSARSAVYFILALSFIVFLAIAMIGIYNEGLGNFVATITSINPGYFLLSLIIILVSYSMRYPKWAMYLRRLRVRIPTWKNFVIYMSMYSMDMTPGRWGRAIVSYTINRLSNVKFAATFPAVVTDIFTDFLGFAVVTDAMALIVNRFVLLSFVLTFLLMVPFLFVYIQTPFDMVKKKFKSLRRRFGALRRLDAVFETATFYFRYNRRLGVGSFIYSMIITVPSMILNGMALYVIMLGFGVPLTASQVPLVLFIFSSSLVLGMVTGIPGTLGVTDAALISQLQYFFPMVMGLGLASAITIVFRIATVWFVQGFGFAAFVYTLRYWKE